MTIKPKKVQRHGKEKWVVSVGKRFGYKRRTKKYFNSRAEGQKFIDDLQEQKKQFGESASQLTYEQRTDAAVAYSKLASYKITLVDCADFFIKHHPNGKNSPQFQEFAEEVLKARKLSCGTHTLATYRSELKHVIPDFGKTALNEIYQVEIEDFVSELELAPRTICNVLDTFTLILNEAVRKGWINRNPAEFVPRPKPDLNPIGYLLPPQIALLLCQAQVDRPSMVRPIAIGAFAGLRRAEICRIRESHILLADRLIDLPAKFTKTRQRRLVTILPNLLEWLESTEPSEGPLAGTENPDVFGQWLRELAIAAGIQPWPHNALRHSFGSCLIAINKNEFTTAAEMGNTPDVVIRNYRAIVRPEIAKVFFGIRPANVLAIATPNSQPKAA